MTSPKHTPSSSDPARAFLEEHFGPGEMCPFCGMQPELELDEIWGPREFQLSTCCEGMHDLACRVLSEGGNESADVLRSLEVEELCGTPGRLRRVVDNGLGQLILDWAPTVVPIKQAVAKAFVNEHHEHCDAPAGWRFGAGLMNGADLIGVVMVGRPVARMLDQHSTVEVNRLCIRRDVPAPLVWNGCSQLYAYAARQARKRGFKRIYTYTLQSEGARSLIAAGWTLDGPAGGGSWSCKSRPREDKSPTERKNRWSKNLQPSPSSSRPRRAAVQCS